MGFVIISSMSRPLRAASLKLLLPFVFLLGWQAGAAALSYTLVEADHPSCKGPCPKVIAASGTIGQEEYLEFFAFLKDARSRHRISNTMLLESRGGFVSGAMVLGVLLRKLGMDVVVARPAGGPITRHSGVSPATCASACVLALVGGRKRSYVRGSQIGVHHPHLGPEVLDPVTRKPINGVMDEDRSRYVHARYFKMMGIDQKLWQLIEGTASNDIRWMTPDDLRRYRVAVAD